MKPNDVAVPKDDASWADYCDALAHEAWLESRKADLPATKPGLRTVLRDDGKTARFPAST